jgi:hypothetical protein
MAAYSSIHCSASCYSASHVMRSLTALGSQPRCGRSAIALITHAYGQINPTHRTTCLPSIFESQPMSDDTGEGQMMAIPFGMFGQQRPPKKPAKPPMDLVQAMDLLSAYTKSEEEHPMIAGELYVEKEGVGVFTDDEPDHRIVVVLWRMLQKDDELDYRIAREHAKNTRACVPDCIIGRKHDGEFIMMAYESWRLEPYTGPRE